MSAMCRSFSVRFSCRRATARAKPAIWAVASVPDRRPPSWPPPGSRGRRFRRAGAVYRAPAPLGPPILWADRLIRSTPQPTGSQGTFRKPCTASQCSRARLFFSRSRRATSCTGKMQPVSLFTSIMLTSTVSSRRAWATCSTVTWPVLSGARYVTSYPCCCSSLHCSSTALCSTAVVMMCRPVWRPCHTAAEMAQLSDSVPQEVKCRFSGRHPRAPATTARPSSTRALASRPRGYWDEGFPNCSVST